MKTNNYLGRHDENRGIVLFCLVFGIIIAIVLGMTLASNSNKKDDEGVSNASKIASIVEDDVYSVSKFELDGDKLVIEGELNEEVTDSIVTKLQDIELVFKDTDGDKYTYELNYYIATDKIEFSTLSSGNESSIDLSQITKGEYFVLLRIKFESTKSEEGYKYRYYTLKNDTENNIIEYNDMNIYFDSTENNLNYLTIEEK